MFGLGIRYLNGWAMAAADGARKEQPEWPPHPDRVFMALAAAWFETGEEPAEGAALRWLEALDPPALAASDAQPRRADRGRRAPTCYVPVNDTRLGRKLPAGNEIAKLKDAGLGLLPEYRSRQPRGFPVAVPHEPVVHLIWGDADPGGHLQALERLAGKVTHVGHSASLVQVWVTADPKPADWVPVTGMAPHRLRVTGGGRLDYLRERCNRQEVTGFADLEERRKTAKGKEKKALKTQIEKRFGSTAPVSLRPEPARWVGYDRPAAEPATAIPGTLFDPRLVVLTLSGRRVSLPATLRLTNALRCTLLRDIATLGGQTVESCPDEGDVHQLLQRYDYPEWLSGHAPDGGRTAKPHLALLPLPFAGAEHADGRVMGLALALPRELGDPAAPAQLLEPWLRETETGLPRSIRLFDGRWLECSVELETRESLPRNLRRETWTRTSRSWASVTPLVLDRHFKGEDKWEKAAESVKDGCERIGLPRPREVLLHPVSLVEGVPHARDFPPLTRKRDGGRMHHTHAVILFDSPVAGPLLVGAGRFRGYGLFRPMDSRENADG